MNLLSFSNIIYRLSSGLLLLISVCLKTFILVHGSPVCMILVICNYFIFLFHFLIGLKKFEKDTVKRNLLSIHSSFRKAVHG